MLLPKKTIPYGTQDTPVRVHLRLCIRWDVLTHDSDLALQIIDNLGVHEPDQTTLMPMPSPDFIHQSLECEAVRRIFWLIHLLDVMASIHFKNSTTFTPRNRRLWLPVDETNFGMGVHSIWWVAGWFGLEWQRRVCSFANQWVHTTNYQAYILRKSSGRFPDHDVGLIFQHKWCLFGCAHIGTSNGYQRDLCEVHVSKLANDFMYKYLISTTGLVGSTHPGIF